MLPYGNRTHHYLDRNHWLVWWNNQTKKPLTVGTRLFFHRSSLSTLSFTIHCQHLKPS